MNVCYVYRGIPMVKGGTVVAVRRARSIAAHNGVRYRGVLAKDSRGRDFVFKKYPCTTVETAREASEWDDAGAWVDAVSWTEGGGA